MSWKDCDKELPEPYRDVPIQLADGTLRVGRLTKFRYWEMASYQKCKYQYGVRPVRWFDTPEPQVWEENHEPNA